MNMNCVYCDEANKFDIEHVFPAGLGGDDKLFLLINCVCEKCNNYFSGLEVELSRKTPSALARLIQQTVGRDRNGKTAPPTVQVENSYIIDLDGNFLEAKVSAKMKVALVPQLLINGNVINFTAGDPDELEAFLTQLKTILSGDTLNLIEKKTELGSKKFLVRIVHLGPALTLGEALVQDKPPLNSIWIKEGLQTSKDMDGKTTANLTPRFYHHDGKTINYKSPDSSKILDDLSKARQFTSQYKGDATYVDSEINQPVVSMEMGFDYRKMTQALAKIGMNFIIYLAGPEYARDPSFQSIKSKIRWGNSDIQVKAVEPSDPFNSFIGSPPNNSHLMALHSFPVGAGRYVLIFHLKLYGGIPFELVLSENSPTPLWGVETQFALVYFNEHRIEALNSLEYHLRQ